MGERSFRGIIALTGPKHTGKTNCGRRLATLLSCRFIDLDDEIQARSGKTPRELYLEGPDRFKEAEMAALAGLLLGCGERSPGTFLVLAAGGGIIDNAPAFGALRAASLLVYLEVSAATAWRRIEAAARTGGFPPFLRGENPELLHRELHERRAAAYRNAADLVVDAGGKDIEELAQAVHGEIKKGMD